MKVTDPTHPASSRDNSAFSAGTAQSTQHSRGREGGLAPAVWNWCEAGASDPSRPLECQVAWSSHSDQAKADWRGHRDAVSLIFPHDLSCVVQVRRSPQFSFTCLPDQAPSKPKSNHAPQPQRHQRTRLPELILPATSETPLRVCPPRSAAEPARPAETRHRTSL